MTEDWGKISADLERLLKLRSFVFGMKLFEKREEMEAIPRIRRPQNVHTLDQVVGQAARLGWTIGITSDNLVGAQCRAVVGLGNAKDDGLALRQAYGRGLVQQRRGRRRPSGRDGMRPRRALRGAGAVAACRAAGSTRPTSRCSMRPPGR